MFLRYYNKQCSNVKFKIENKMMMVKKYLVLYKEYFVSYANYVRELSCIYPLTG